MAPGVYKTFKKSLNDNLKKYLDYSNDSDDIKEVTKNRIESIINQDYKHLDEMLIHINYNKYIKNILASNKIIENSVTISSAI